MKTELSYYDIYPKVFPEGKTVKITVRPLGDHAAFPTRPMNLRVIPLEARDHPSGLVPTQVREFPISPDPDGALRFSCAFSGEQEHYLRLLDDNRTVAQWSVYSVREDLAGRYPYMGDLHVHTCRSDGRESPAVVCANYRKMGYDFLAITDHRRYAPSLEAIHAYEGAPIDLCIVPGEEVHLPDNPIHAVNFGGLYSINGLLESQQTWSEGSPDGPAPISDEMFREAALSEAKKFDLSGGVDPLSFGACAWIFDRIREAGGLAIFPHPYWIEGNGAYHASAAFTQCMLDAHPFDAFELLGGERYFNHNGFQNLAYQEARARGRRFPVVGSSDSHGTVNNANFDTAKTIVYARANGRAAIIEAVKGHYCVAVDTISREVRLCGELRMAKYAQFLLENYFPLHDELCFEEGRAMKDFACGADAGAALETLARTKGRTETMLRKYFDL